MIMTNTVIMGLHNIKINLKQIRPENRAVHFENHSVCQISC